jgi:ribonuclease BN (tRNA processing enzyme)
MIRIFHPVGQGAFYTEHHQIRDKGFSIVYDCGSLTLNVEERKKMIEDFFPKGAKIEILFISHFDADHINGIKALKDHCEIKRVIIPLLNPETKTLLIARNAIRYKFFETQIIDDPVSFFGDTPVTMVEEVSIGKDLDSEEEINEETIINELGHKIKSGKSIRLDKKDNWYYIPYNYKQSDRRKQFVEALEAMGIRINDINSTLTDYL